jgi:hypothetical protein
MAFENPSQEAKDDLIAEAVEGHQQDKVNEWAQKMSASPNEEYHTLPIEEVEGGRIIARNPIAGGEVVLSFEDKTEFHKAMAAAGFYQEGGEWKIAYQAWKDGVKT